MLRAFRKLYTPDPDLSKIQGAIEQVLNPLVKIPYLNGIILENLSITTSPVKFAHGLGRAPVGYWLIYKNAAGDVYAPTVGTIGPFSGTTITLQASAAVTVNILVF